MKKPNITEGEWKFNGIGGVVDEDDDTICAIHSMRIKKDAKAISAVPEMLDALIASKRFVDVVADESVEIDRDLKTQIEQALKKAGCSE